MRINTNVASLTSQDANLNTNKSLSSSLEKLSTGLKINKAADDASGLAIADKLRTQATSLTQGLANANSASALIQIADKAMAEQSTILDTVKAKLIQAATATTTDAGREAIRKDITKLLDQIDEIASQTNYNGITLLQQSDTDTAKQSALTFQLGEEYSYDVTLTQTNASNTSDLGGGATSIATAAVGTAVTHPVTGVSSTQGNNIASNGGTQSFTGSSSVALGVVDIGEGDLEAGSTSVAIDIDLSGSIGTVVAGAESITIDATNQTQEIKDVLAALAQGNAVGAGFWETSAGSETYVLGATDSVSFGDIDFSALNLTSVYAAGASLTINDDQETVDFSVTNNVGSAAQPNTGQLNIIHDGTMVGGQLLSSLKNLAADGLTNDLANSYMETVDEAITQLNSNRADFGSSQNQIESSIRSMQTTVTNLKAAESVIRDVDYAAESANFNKQNIVAQAGTYAMSQANAVSQNVLRLLQ
jgi:flagellin